MCEHFVLKMNYYGPCVARKTMTSQVWIVQGLRYERALFEHAERRRILKLEIVSCRVGAICGVYSTKRSKGGCKDSRMSKVRPMLGKGHIQPSIARENMMSRGCITDVLLVDRYILEKASEEEHGYLAFSPLRFLLRKGHIWLRVEKPHITNHA